LPASPTTPIPRRLGAPAQIGEPPAVIVNVYFVILFLGLVVLELNLPSIGGGARNPDDPGTRIAFPIFILSLIVLMPLALSLLRFSLSLRIPWLSVVLYGVYAGWCVTTALWSPMTVSSAVHALVLLTMIALAVAGAAVGIEKTLKIFLFVCLAVMLASWLVLPVLPDFALRFPDVFRLRGVMMHEFRLGYLAAAALLASTCVLARREHFPSIGRAFTTVVFVVAAVTLLATQTRSLTVYTLLCFGLVAFFWGKPSLRAAVTAVFVAALLAGLAFSGPVIEAFTRGEQDATLTGRTMVWARTLTLAEPHWLLGAGFKSYLHPSFDWIFTEYRPPHAHNAYLNAYFETGVVGAGLLLLFNLAVLVESWRFQRLRGVPSISFYLFLLITMSGMTGVLLGSMLATLVGFALVFFVQEGCQAYAAVQPAPAPAPAAAPPPPRRLGDRWVKSPPAAGAVASAERAPQPAAVAAEVPTGPSRRRRLASPRPAPGRSRPA
jgi:O-antigen ligase